MLVHKGNYFAQSHLNWAKPLYSENVATYFWPLGSLRLLSKQTLDTHKGISHSVHLSHLSASADLILQGGVSLTGLTFVVIDDRMNDIVDWCQQFESNKVRLTYSKILKSVYSDLPSALVLRFRFLEDSVLFLITWK